MANYTAADIKALRERTGAGMLDVKKALDEADGNTEKAIEIIRVKGLKGVSKREDRSTSDGVVLGAVVADGAGEAGYIVEVNSETDFVAKNGKFVALAQQVLDAAVASGAGDAATLLATEVDGETVQAIIDGAAATLGEKIVLRRVARLTGEKVSLYLHKVSKDLPPQVGVLVATDANGAEVGVGVAQHIAAFSPTYLTREDVPADVVAKEREIAEETAKNEGKPEAALPKIVEGRLVGFYKENVLVEQAFAPEPKKTVAQAVADAGSTLQGFARFRVGV